MASKTSKTSKKVEQMEEVPQISKSEAIRQLLRTGQMSRGQIAKAVGVRYQMVRNVEVRMSQKEVAN